MTKNDIINEITDYINSSCPNNTPYSQLYIGIANDGEDRVFNDHCVDKDKDVWIICPSDTEQIARDVEKHFLNLGMDGGTGGGKNINYVYCFLQNEHTKR